MRRSFHFLSVAGMLVLAFISLASCSQSTDPAPTGEDRSEVLGEGSFDPSANSFVLKTFDNPPPGGGPAIRVQLIGSNMVVNADSGFVSIDVAIGNLHNGPIYAPTIVWLSDFSPSDKEVLNADLVMGPMGSDPNDPSGEQEYGFDYSEFFGDDGVLGPEEISETKTWMISTQDGSSFSFGARVEMGMIPDLPRIAGYCWYDGNHNGIAEPDEEPLGYGIVDVRFPNGQVAGIMVDPMGHYSLPVIEAGLYSVHFDPMIDTFAPLGFSTPNPQEVLLTLGPDGHPNSFTEANFGMYTDVFHGPVIQFTDMEPDSLQVGGFQLLAAQVQEPASLVMQVGFSGCGPDESFSLFMTGGFMESSPPQANIVLRKDFETDCDAVWQNEIRFDLGPLVHRYLESYGFGVLVLNLYDASGDVRQLELAMFPPHD